MDERRVIDYFIVVGVPESKSRVKDLPVKVNDVRFPITDIALINKSQGESCPKDYECIELTPSGYSANLNHGSVLASEIFLCYKRGRNKPPIIDLGVLYAGKDFPKSGCEILTETPYGRSANVNNTGGEKIFFTFIRADKLVDSDSLAVVDICVIIRGKNEKPPRTFHVIEKTLNKGVIGSDIYLCYKKSVMKNRFITYEAAVLLRHPSQDLPSFPLPEQQVAMFCLPLGATVESWPVNSRHPLPIFSTFVLTDATGQKVYGAAVIFYEEYDRDNLTPMEKKKLDVSSSVTVHQNQSICILSRWPFFETFKKFLLCMYRISVSGPQLIPLERHIGHFMFEVPFPTRERPKILIQLSTESVTLSLPEETPLPKSGASFVKMLMNLGPDNIISLLFYVLMEHRIVIHSLRPDLLTSIAEAVVTMIFPFRWQCPYIPLCPLQLSAVLDSPTPFIIGLDSQYFELFDDPPSDITFVDLDTCTITVSEERKFYNSKLLPKRAVKILQSRLEELYNEYIDDPSHPATPDELDHHGAFNLREFRGYQKMHSLEISIQDAFLHFMASLLKDYESFLLPITEAPVESVGTDIRALFDVQGFVNSREKSYRSFYKQMMKTQYFSHFIDERSFVSDENTGLAFFDACIQKLQTDNNATLIDYDEMSSQSERTVFVLPPDSTGLPSGVTYSYNGFSHLKLELFLPMSKEVVVKNVSSTVSSSSSILRRSKQEVRRYQKVLLHFADQPEPIAKCFVWICYSLWFISLPSYLENVHSKVKLLDEAFEIVQRLHKLEIQPLDDVCYRVMMHLCCIYNQPVLAVKIYHEMKEHGIVLNAVTYGFYHKAVVESNWSETSVNSSTRLWKKLRNVIRAASFLRNSSRIKASSLTHSRVGNGDTQDGKKNRDKKTKNETSGMNVSILQKRLSSSDNRLSTKDDTLSSTDDTLSSTDNRLSNKDDTSSFTDDTLSSTDNRLSTKDDTLSSTDDTLSSTDNRLSNKDDTSSSSMDNILSSMDDKENNEKSSSEKTKKRVVSVLTPVTENDPLGLLQKTDDDEDKKDVEGVSKSSPEILRRTSSLNEHRVRKQSKSKSCDELTIDDESSMIPFYDDKIIDVSRSNNVTDASRSRVKDDTIHAKTLSQVDRLKWKEANEMQRTGSFGNVFHSAFTLFSSTYHNLRDSLSTSNSSQNIHLDSNGGIGGAGGGGGIGRETQSERRHHYRGGGSLMLLQTEQRALSDDNLSIRHDNKMKPELNYDYLKSDSTDGLVSSDVHVDIEAVLCTQTKCSNCSNLLYDEEIMAGWTSNDSNLKTRCLCCGYNFVPMMQITLKDFCCRLDEEKNLTVNEKMKDDNASSSRCEDVSDGNLLSNEVKDNVKTRIIFSSESDNNQEKMSVKKIFSLSDDVENEGDNEITKRHSADLEESFSHPYLSPLVLKKEVENLIELKGEESLNKSSLIDDHPIIFWNLIWFFKRLKLSSHLNNFIVNSTILMKNKDASENLNVLVKVLWDGVHNHKEFGPPMYVLWKHHPRIVMTETDEVMLFTNSFMQILLSHLIRDDIQSAIEKVLSERKRIRRKGKILYRSLYHDILFLSITHHGKSFNIEKFDLLYKEACNDLSPGFSARLMEADRAPKNSSIICRQLFGQLVL